MIQIFKRLRRNAFDFGILTKPGDQRGQGTVEYLLVIGTISIAVTLLLWVYLEPTVKDLFRDLVDRIIKMKPR